MVFAPLSQILNPRQPRPGEDRPSNADVKPSASAVAAAAADTATSSTSPARAASGTPAPPSKPTPPVVSPGLPLGMTPAQQAAMVRQQQFQAQQQQQMMLMQQQMIAANGGAGLPSLPMLQQNAFRLSSMLQNPAMPPPMRMQLQGQLQQTQVMMMQLQNLQVMQQRMAMSMASNGGGGGGGGRNGPSMAAAGMPPATLPRHGAVGTGASTAKSPGVGNGAAGGIKREREDETLDGSPAAKKAEPA